MKIEEIKIGMKVKFRNQVYEGKVLYIREWVGDVQVQFAGYDEPEHVDPMFLRPF